MKKKNKQNEKFKDFLKKRKAFEYELKNASPKRRKKLLKDSDNDGLTDYEEKHIYKTNPHNPDTDGDGMSDGWEVRLGRNPRGKGRLKDLFIPHKGNNYQPESLSFKRLLFHGLGAIAIKIVIVSLFFSFPASAWMTPDVLKAESKKIIDFTNKERENLEIAKLKENEKLNESAYEKAQNMLIDQYFAHTDKEKRGLEYWIKLSGYDFSIAGENLALGFTTAEKTVQAWIESPTHYANIKDANFQEIGVAMVSGPYKGTETNLAVQYFARPKQTVRYTAQSIKTSVEVPEIAEKTEIEIVETPEKEMKVLAIKAELPEYTKSAIVQIKNKEIALEEVTPQNWEAKEIIYEKEEKEIKDPIIPATISIEDGTEITKTAEIANTNIEPKEITKTDQYQVYRANPSGLMSIVSSLGTWYFKLLLALALISLSLAVFKEIKKQHPHLIVRSVFFVILLVVLIVF